MAGFTITDLSNRYPDESSCLDRLFRARYGSLKRCPKCKKQTKFYRIKARKTYGCKHCGHQLSPTAGTIFHKSSTPLKLWFHALYLFTISKNGVSAKELQRQLGVTYKTAWRMGHKIRELLIQNKEQLTGVVEADETYYGGNNMNKRWRTYDPATKQVIFGMVERDGKIRVKHVMSPGARILLGEIQENVSRESILLTDELGSYRRLQKLGYNHRAINHTTHYVDGKVHTNTIESFWNQLKRSLSGTYNWVSPVHLQSYLDEFAFRHNHKNDVHTFHNLVSRAAQPSR